jgi:rod shape determining protein RodA
MLAFSFVLIVKQPDLGTALILLFTGFTMLWMANISPKFFLYGGLLVLLTAPLSWHFLKPYQRNRIFVFLGYGDVKKERYQIEQSKIAIGSGGLWGKGFLQGTQNKLQFLPESRTDFIFSVIAEEMGFLGTLFLLLLYALLFLRFFMLIGELPSLTMQLFALGIVAHIIISAIINIGMVIDLLPVVGIPLPLVSYGVSNLWITFASLGIFNGITSRR